MHRNVDHSTVPPGRTVIQFQFMDAAPNTRTWWLVLSADDADVCDADPGNKTTAEVHDYHDVRTGVLASSLAKRAVNGSRVHQPRLPRPRRLGP